MNVRKRNWRVIEMIGKIITVLRRFDPRGIKPIIKGTYLEHNEYIKRIMRVK